MGRVLVTNTGRMQTPIYSHTGDSVDIPPLVVDFAVDEKFIWNLPKNIVSKKPSVTSSSIPIEYVSTIDPDKSGSDKTPVEATSTDVKVLGN